MISDWLDGLIEGDASSWSSSLLTGFSEIGNTHFSLKLRH